MLRAFSLMVSLCLVAAAGSAAAQPAWPDRPVRVYSLLLPPTFPRDRR